MQRLRPGFWSIDQILVSHGETFSKSVAAKLDSSMKAAADAFLDVPRAFCGKIKGLN